MIKTQISFYNNDCLMDIHLHWSIKGNSCVMDYDGYTIVYFIKI